ncbi:hypothetical protein, partial [Microbacterium sp. ZXX196]|uniref:hypothetical protein n=1 Tax=Microbacterium sp. ZXX196 TaxID=2609291 RepID=UPI00132752D2|nr:hypothetical protein [Microbacterium sp. ZXX196]
GRFRTEFSSPDAEATAIAVSSKHAIATGGSDGVIRLWRFGRETDASGADTPIVPTAHFLQALAGHTKEVSSLAFSRTGAALAS